MKFPNLKKWLQRGGKSPKPGWDRRGMQVYRLILAGIVIAILTYLSPYQRPFEVPELRVGTEAPKQLEAFVLFQVPKRAAELESERLDAERTIPTVLKAHRKVRGVQQSRLDSVLKVLLPPLTVQMADSLKRQHLQKTLPEVAGALPEEALSILIRVLSAASPAYVQEFQKVCIETLDSLYKTGIVDDKDFIDASATPQVRIDNNRSFDSSRLYSAILLKKGNIPELVWRDVSGQDSTTAQIYLSITGGEAMKAVHQILRLFVEPSLTVDVEETTRLRREARRSVASIKRIYSEGDVIVEKGVKITEEHVDALNALANEVARSEREDPLKLYLQTIAAALVTAFLTLVFGYFRSDA